jgi:hypothetical protein
MKLVWIPFDQDLVELHPLNNPAQAPVALELPKLLFIDCTMRRNVVVYTEILKSKPDLYFHRATKINGLVTTSFSTTMITLYAITMALCV